MAKEKNTKTHNIFLLNKEKVQEKLLGGAQKTIDEIIDEILKKDVGYKEQQLKPLPDDCPFQVKLFFNDEHYSSNRLASFCKSFVQDGQDILKFNPKTASSILFIWSNEHTFVITTGQGFRLVEDYCQPKFGLIVISIFKNLFRITALDSNGMSSIIHSSKTIYSNEIDFVDVETLDTIFKEITGRLNSKETVRKLLNLDEKSQKKSIKITGKNYVQFSSSMDFSSLVHLLKILNEYDFSTIQESFNLIAPLDIKKNRIEVEQNNRSVLSKIYDCLQSNTSVPFDLFNKNAFDFISADSFNIKCNGFIDPLVETDDIDPTVFLKSAFAAYLLDKTPSLDLFIEFAMKASIISYKADSIITAGTILSHISGEINRDGQNYYVFYGEYYWLNSSYSDRLNRSLKGKLSQDRFVNMLSTKWETDEDVFNEQASNEQKLIHLHKIKPEFIEFADLMKVEDSVITIIHVKDGFDCDMRALDRQIELSATRVNDAKNNNNTDYLDKLYERASLNKKGINITNVFSSKNEFIDAIKTREIKFVVAIHPPKDDLLACESNIAKHCLNALILRCFNQSIDLKINIIK